MTNRELWEQLNQISLKEENNKQSLNEEMSEEEFDKIFDWFYSIYEEAMKRLA